MVLLSTTPHFEGKLAVFAGMEGVRFRRMVVPGDRLDLECTIIKMRPPIGKMLCKASVNGESAAEAEITCSLIDRKLLEGGAS